LFDSVRRDCTHEADFDLQEEFLPLPPPPPPPPSPPLFPSPFRQSYNPLHPFVLPPSPPPPCPSIRLLRPPFLATFPPFPLPPLSPFSFPRSFEHSCTVKLYTYRPLPMKVFSYRDDGTKFQEILAFLGKPEITATHTTSQQDKRLPSPVLHQACPPVFKVCPPKCAGHTLGS
jgi:hypothetical protein